MTKKVISFSVWGTNPDYLRGAEFNALMASSVYPGWETWFYVEKGTDVTLENIATKVIYYNSEPGCDGAFQRFRPMQDPTVDIFVSRDCDSRLSDREYQAVLEWESSEKQFHAMRDHPAHQVPVMAGMWGAKRNHIINIDFMYNELCKWKNGKYFDDQYGLKFFYDMLSGLFIEHDDLKRYNGKLFPKHSKMVYGSFVGQRIKGDNSLGII